VADTNGGLLEIGRLLVIVGCTLLILGLVLTFAGRVPGLGRLPGDIVYRRGNFTFYFPLATSIVLSLVLTALLWLFRR
jgi:hypothetical protein